MSREGKSRHQAPEEGAKEATDGKPKPPERASSHSFLQITGQSSGGGGGMRQAGEEMAHGRYSITKTKEKKKEIVY